MTTILDGTSFRHVMGHYPTGVCVVTAIDELGESVAMVVGSFTSVSLDPMLVAFLPARTSTSWARIEKVGKFCINVLASDQQSTCAAIGARRQQPLADIAHRSSPGGAPLLDNVIAWIDCDIYAVHDAGDHVFVLGEVQRMAVERDADPLIFHRGGYGGVARLPDALNPPQS